MTSETSREPSGRVAAEQRKAARGPGRRAGGRRGEICVKKKEKKETISPRAILLRESEKTSEMVRRTRTS